MPWWQRHGNRNMRLLVMLQPQSGSRQRQTLVLGSARSSLLFSRGPQQVEMASSHIQLGSCLPSLVSSFRKHPRRCTTGVFHGDSKFSPVDQSRCYMFHPREVYNVMFCVFTGVCITSADVMALHPLSKKACTILLATTTAPPPTTTTPSPESHRSTFGLCQSSSSTLNPEECSVLGMASFTL